MLKLPVVLLLVFFSMAASASAQANRTWVSGVGDDANPCSLTAPCKTWAGAISKTAAGGEIDALDNGGFGALTITKSITIDGGGLIAGALGSSGQSVFLVNLAEADTQQRVNLRNISISSPQSLPAAMGVRIEAARNVYLENVTITGGFTQHGIDLTPLAASTTDMNLTLDRVRVFGSGGNALNVGAANATQKLNVLVRDSSLMSARGLSGTAGETGIGVSADTGAHVWLSGTTVFGNLIGVQSFNRSGGTAGIVDSFCDNQITANSAAGVVPNSLCPPVVNTVTTTVPGPAPPAVTVTKTVTVPAACEVPKLKGLTLAFAKRLLAAARCKLGTVTKKKTTKRKLVGTVLAQRTAAGKVNVTVGKR